MLGLFARTKKKARRYGIAFVVGIISGIMSAFVKSGTEGILPPRTPGRAAPPVELLQDLGLDAQDMVYSYSHQLVNWAGSTVHILFSVVAAVIYCMLAEVFPKIKLLQGLVFGFIVAIAFHGLLLPFLELSPSLLHIPGDEIISELIGTFLWIWTIEIFRRDLRNRITKQPDPECK